MGNRKAPYLYKKTGSLTHIFCPIYQKNIYGSCGVTKETFIKNLKKQLNLELSVEEVPGNGIFLIAEYDDQEFGFVWSEDKDVVLAHECLHAACWVLRSVGLPLTSESEEAYTYYQQFLMECILGRK